MYHQPRSVRHLVFGDAEQFDVKGLLRSISRRVATLEYDRMAKWSRVMGIGDHEIPVDTTVIEPSLIDQQSIGGRFGNTLKRHSCPGSGVQHVIELPIPLDPVRLDMTDRLTFWSRKRLRHFVEFCFS